MAGLPLFELAFATGSGALRLRPLLCFVVAGSSLAAAEPEGMSADLSIAGSLVAEPEGRAADLSVAPDLDGFVEGFLPRFAFVFFDLRSASVAQLVQALKDFYKALWGRFLSFIRIAIS